MVTAHFLRQTDRVTRRKDVRKCVQVFVRGFAFVFSCLFAFVIADLNCSDSLNHESLTFISK